MEEAKKVAKAEGVAVNQLINVAVAEKVSALRTEDYFAERAARGDIKKAVHVLKRREGQCTSAWRRTTAEATSPSVIAGGTGTFGRHNHHAAIELRDLFAYTQTACPPRS